VDVGRVTLIRRGEGYAKPITKAFVSVCYLCMCCYNSLYVVTVLYVCDIVLFNIMYVIRMSPLCAPFSLQVVCIHIINNVF